MASALAPFYDDDFENFLAEDSDDPQPIGRLLMSYAMNFGSPFFNLDQPRQPNVSEDELRRWIEWCLFYGKPRDEYPEANKD